MIELSLHALTRGSVTVTVVGGAFTGGAAPADRRRPRPPRRRRSDLNRLGFGPAADPARSPVAE